ncbi:hypothetical protein EJB05_53144, partial [Eragrostis curvula]
CRRKESDPEEHAEDSSLGGTAGTDGSDERRVRTEAQWPTDKVIVTAIAPDGMPIPKKERQRMRRLAGLIARQKVSLLLPRFSSLGKDGKKLLFADFVMPFLEFNKEMEAKGLKRAMKAISKCWRNYKSTLVKEYMLKKRSPFKRFKHLKEEDYNAFVELKGTEEFQKVRERFKNLREKNKHPHHLGTAGYDGKIEVWAAKDEKLEKDGLPNPCLLYPGRARTWLRARGRLTPSGEITFNNQETMGVSDKIKELSEDSLSVTGKEDALTKALGNPEHPGRVQGVSSYQGWKIALPGYKRKRDSEEYMQKLAESIRSQNLQEVIASIPSILATQDLKIVPGSPSPNQISPADRWRSSCSSIDAPVTMRAEHDIYNDLMVQREPPLVPEMDPDSISLLTEPTNCTLLANIGGYQVQVAMGQVHPEQYVLHTVEVTNGFVVVFVDSVVAKLRDEKLERPVNDEVTTVGEALLQRVQWRRTCVVINDSPMEKVRSPRIPDSNPKPPLGPKKADKSANSIDQGKNGEDKNAKKAKGSDQCSQHDAHQGSRKPNKGSKSSQQDLRVNVSNPHDKAEAKKAISIDIGKKIKAASNASAAAAKCSIKSASIQIPNPSVWTQPNFKFKYGQVLMSTADLEKAGPNCTSLHNYYMNGCKEKKKQIVVFIRPNHLLRRVEAPFIVDYADLYDLFNIDALDMSIVRVFTLYMHKESKNNNWPIAVLDPQMLVLSVIKDDKDGEVVTYVAKAISQSSKTKEFLMFPCNTGGHWIAVIIFLKWKTIYYLDSLLHSGTNYDIEILTDLLDRAWALYIASDAKEERTRRWTHICYKI